VYNPYASSLKLPSSLRDRRRLQMLYIHYVDTITNLFQYQRNITKDGKLIATKEDCALAFQLMFDCILIKLDELDGSLRQLYEQLKEWVKTNSNGTLQGFTFTQREVRQDLNINNQSLKRYINDLLELEYIQLKTGGKQGSTNRYELVYWDDYGKMKAGLKEEMKEKLAQLTHSTN
jgi:DNA primase